MQKKLRIGDANSIWLAKNSLPSLCLELDNRYLDHVELWTFHLGHTSAEDVRRPSVYTQITRKVMNEYWRNITEQLGMAQEGSNVDFGGDPASFVYWF